MAKFHTETASKADKKHQQKSKSQIKEKSSTYTYVLPMAGTFESIRKRSITNDSPASSESVRSNMSELLAVNPLNPLNPLSYMNSGHNVDEIEEMGGNPIDKCIWEIAGLNFSESPDPFSSDGGTPQVGKIKKGNTCEEHEKPSPLFDPLKRASMVLAESALSNFEEKKHSKPDHSHQGAGKLNCDTTCKSAINRAMSAAEDYLRASTMVDKKFDGVVVNQAMVGNDGDGSDDDHEDYRLLNPITVPNPNDIGLSTSESPPSPVKKLTLNVPGSKPKIGIGRGWTVLKKTFDNQVDPETGKGFYDQPDDQDEEDEEYIEDLTFRWPKYITRKSLIALITTLILVIIFIIATIMFLVQIIIYMTTGDIIGEKTNHLNSLKTPKITKDEARNVQTLHVSSATNNKADDRYWLLVGIGVPFFCSATCFIAGVYSYVVRAIKTQLEKEELRKKYDFKNRKRMKGTMREFFHRMSNISAVELDKKIADGEVTTQDLHMINSYKQELERADRVRSISKLSDRSASNERETTIPVHVPVDNLRPISRNTQISNKSILKGSNDRSSIRPSPRVSPPTFVAPILELSSNIELESKHSGRKTSNRRQKFCPLNHKWSSPECNKHLNGLFGRISPIKSNSSDDFFGGEITCSSVFAAKSPVALPVSSSSVKRRSKLRTSSKSPSKSPMSSISPKIRPISAEFSFSDSNFNNFNNTCSNLAPLPEPTTTRKISRPINFSSSRSSTALDLDSQLINQSLKLNKIEEKQMLLDFDLSLTDKKDNIFFKTPEVAKYQSSTVYNKKNKERESPSIAKSPISFTPKSTGTTGKRYSRLKEGSTGYETSQDYQASIFDERYGNNYGIMVDSEGRGVLRNVKIAIEDKHTVV